MNSSLSETLQKLLFAIIFIVGFFIILTYMLSMGLGILVFFSTAEGLKFSQDPIRLYPLLIEDVEITVNAGLYFLFLWWIFALCFAAAWRYRDDLPSRVREFFSGDTKQSPLSNNLLAMPAITSMLLVVTIVLHFLQTQGGIRTGEPRITEPFLDFIRFSRAPLVEEMIFRIIPIGTFLVTYIFVAGKRTRPDFSWSQRLKTCVLSVLQPEKAKKMIGLRTIGDAGLLGGIFWAEWMMIFLTAFLFGIAHYFGDWELGKISPAAVSGAVFALAYLYYGVQAPILLHWYFNSYFSIFDLSLDYYSAEIDFLSLSWLANIFLGVLLWVLLIIFGVVAIFGVVRRKPKAIPVPEPPSTNV